MTLQQVRHKKNQDRANRPNKQIVLFATIILALVSIFLYSKYTSTEENTNTKNNQDEEIVAALEKLTILPDETPTILTINDVEKLKAESPATYIDAKNGDKVLIYSDKLLIYRKSENKIINIVNITNEQ